MHTDFCFIILESHRLIAEFLLCFIDFLCSRYFAPGEPAENLEEKHYLLTQTSDMGAKTVTISAMDLPATLHHQLKVRYSKDPLPKYLLADNAHFIKKKGPTKVGLVKLSTTALCL